MSQINYKLSDYTTGTNTYKAILAQDKANKSAGDAEEDEAAEEKLDADEVTDIIVNFLACESSLAHSSLDEIRELQQKYCSSEGFEKTYEYFFNLS